MDPAVQARCEVLGIRFKDSKVAEEFRVNFERCQQGGPISDSKAGLGGDVDEEYPLITRRGFWEEEGGNGNPAACCPLLNRNGGFLKDPVAAANGRDLNETATAQFAATLNREALERASRWPALCGADAVRTLPPVSVESQGRRAGSFLQDSARHVN
jgi:hypothetical protein